MVVEHKPAPRICAEFGCSRPGTVLDARGPRLPGGAPRYICQMCCDRLYPELIAPKPERPDLPIFGGQYPGGIHTKPMTDRQQRRRWRS